MARRRGAAATGVPRRAEAARTTRATRATRSSATQADPDVPGVYKQMLRESGALPSRVTSESAERPLKRRRTGRQPAPEGPASPDQNADQRTSNLTLRARQANVSVTAEDADEDDDDEGIEFEDVDIPKPTVQTTYRESSDEESDEEDMQLEDVDFGAIFSNNEPAHQQAETLELNLTAAKEALAPSQRIGDRRRPITKEDKERRVEIHKMHMLCLLAHLEKRNHWCNDQVVQEMLRPLLSAKIVQWLNPASNLTQFGQTESLKKGLQMLMEKFQQRFNVTEIGLRRALWAEDEKQLENYGLPDEIDSCLEKADFRKAAKTMTGSRDVGAQLFCALLRAAGVETRLVCSLQPLSFVTGGPTLRKPRQAKTPFRPVPVTVEAARTEPSPSVVIPSPRARIGHPNAAAYIIPDIPARTTTASPRNPPKQKVPIRESNFPVYWVEVLDVGHQKWQPVDPLVTHTIFRANKLEPPAADRENCLSYVIAFEDDGSAKDVTRRYAKAYNAKTRRIRIDGPLVPDETGKKWWRKALSRYKRPWRRSDLEQIESNELSGMEAREPMPRNVADFKDHPVYALERHLRRHEVLVPNASVVGTVGAGSKGPLEKIYRRRDVRLANSVDKWYRLGREIKPGEEPVKVLPRRKRRQRGRRAFDDDEDDSSGDDPILGPNPSKGIPIYSFEQTSLYIPPPVVAGRVPKNKFGNLDLYVPSMVPAGGAHIPHPRAGHAAHVLGVDYAPALMGFDWRGRKGTAVYNGVVVAAEAEEGVRAVIDGFEDLEAMLEEEKRSRRALATWKRLLRGLRIRKSVFGDEDMFDESIPLEDSPMDDEDEEMDDQGSYQGGGGFEPEYYQGGGFEPGGFEPGGFEPEGFEPGVFEPGGFEPGELDHTDVTMDVKGKGKAAAYPNDPNQVSVGRTEGSGSVHRRQRGKRRVLESDDEDEKEEAEIKAPIEETLPGNPTTGPFTQTPEAGGFEIEAALRSISPPAEGIPGVATATDAVVKVTQEHAGPGGFQADVGHDLGFNTADTQAPASQQPGGDLSNGCKTGETRLEGDSEDLDLDFDDAPSDITEEMYMDDDGSLIE